MTIHPISISLLLLFSFYYTPTTATITPTDLFADDVSINCGSSTAAAAANDARKWREDLQRAKGSSIDDKPISTVDPIPYKTARLSRSQFSYTFRLSPGQKTLRLHFNAAAYRGFRTSKDLFSVEAGAFALLRNFSASLTADALGVRSFFKEYCINIKNHQQLHIVFSPEASPSFDTYAFINGIEILSSPASLTYYRGGGDGKVKAVGISLVYVDETTALEVVRRLNIRKDFVSDDGEMFGDREMVPKKESIKMKIYTWITSVDVGFQYLIRIHFSEVGLELVKIFGLTFELNINEMIVIDDTDVGIVAEMDDGISSPPLFRDYILMMNGYIREGKRDLMIYLQSSGGEFILGHGPIACVEILKLSNPDNSLASPNPLPCMQDSSSLQPRQDLLHRILGCRDMIATYAVALLALMIIIIYTLRVILEASFTEKETLLSARAQRVCHKFSLAEIMLATRSFSDAHFVGKGGFGNVYRGVINGCCEDVAIKRLKSSSKQGALEFLTEIETLSEMRHVNLVPLIGYCNDNGEMILVYEYMKNATLADHLYKLPNNGNVCLSLTWKQRLSICIGAGRGLDYLHTGHSFIHRDVKASNILLDEEFVAKVSDFGLAKHLSRSKFQSHVTTKVKGTFWYMDPAYVTTGKLTKKSDVYAFGVLLLEVLSGRPAVDSSVSDEERDLTAWARENISDGNTERIVATNLRGEISKESLKAYVEIASRCLHGEPKKRPTMAQVVLDLEFALDQQERSKSVASYVITSRLNDNCPFEKMASFEPEPGRKDAKRAMVQKPSYLWQRGVLLKRGYNATKAVRKSENMVAPAIPVDELKVKHGSNKQIINIPRISADELKEATDKFGYKCSILEGFHGRIYYAVLQSGQVAAVKKLDSRKQPLQEFLPKVSMIFSLRHEHVVELLACCVDGGLRVLAYEYASNGSLHDVLHGKKGIKDSRPGPALSWRKRVNIAVGAAKGLAYIHDKAQIHGGIRSSNVLLFDDNEVAKITSFDLQYFNKKSNSLLGLKWFSSGRKYVSTCQKSWMSDVYSFGVVLLELLTGSKPIDHTQPLEQQDLVQWVKSKFCDDKVKECVDTRLKGDYPPMAVVKMAEVAVSCTRDDAASRPHMSSVVDALQPLLDTAPREGLDDA